MPNPRLPQEILDYTVDFLHDKPEALKRCCLVSKSWVPRARMHLFADIRLRSKDDLRSWKKTFLNSASSPAYHARTLFIDCPRAVIASDADEGSWIRAFSGISSLDVDNGAWYLNTPEVSLTPFHNFSSTLKSLRMCPIAFPCPELFDLICSSPLLEDLTITGRDESSGNDDAHGPQTVVPSASPPLTGSLGLNIFGGMGNTARRLLDLPNGIHFRRLAFSWHCKEDLPWIMELMVRCSDTLECLDVMCRLPIEPKAASIDLSKARGLKDVNFRPGSRSVEWITVALQTITPEHRDLRRISIRVSYYLTLSEVDANDRRSIGDAISRQWSDLDHCLVQLWDSRSIRPRVVCTRPGGRVGDAETRIGYLLPEMAKRGVIDPD